ncbi:MAG: kynurenine 3-monooxygenase, partial [Calditrichaeota bacterium]
VEIHFNQRCTGFDLQTGMLRLRDEKSGVESTRPAHTVLGSDGSASAVRSNMLKAGDFHFAQDPLEHGYKELTIPPGKDGAFQLEKNALHIWPRHKYMLIALPNLDASFTCTLFFFH